MKLKPLIISFLILAVITAAGYWLNRRDNHKIDDESKVGENLIKAELLTNITEIILRNISDDKTVTLQKDEKGIWILPDFYSLPVEFSKLDNFINSLLEADILRLVTRKKERMDKLEFNNHQIVLKANAETVWTVITGKRGQSGGIFVRMNDEDEAYLANLSSYFDSNVDNWPEKKMLPFQSKDVASLSLEYPGRDSPLTLKRDTAEGEFSSADLLENESLDDSEITRFISTLSSSRYNKIYERDDPETIAARENTRIVSFELFNGTKYTLHIGRRLSEKLNEVESETIESNDTETDFESETGEEAEPEMTEPGPVFIFFEISDPNDRLNDIMQRVSLSYSDYVYNQITESRDKFVKSP